MIQSKSLDTKDACEYPTWKPPTPTLLALLGNVMEDTNHLNQIARKLRHTQLASHN